MQWRKFSKHTITLYIFCCTDLELSQGHPHSTIYIYILGTYLMYNKAHLPSTTCCITLPYEDSSPRATGKN